MFGKRQGMGMNCQQGAGMQTGRGGGNRQGQKGGRGRSMGRGLGAGNGPMIRFLETPEQEIEVLEQTAACLKQNLDQVNSRIEGLKSQREEKQKEQ